MSGKNEMSVVAKVETHCKSNIEFLLLLYIDHIWVDKMCILDTIRNYILFLDWLYNLTNNYNIIPGKWTKF